MRAPSLGPPRTATKGDIEALRIATKGDIDALRIATKADLAVATADLSKALADTQADILIRVFGTFGLQTLVIIGAMITLARMLHRTPADSHAASISRPT